MRLDQIGAKRDDGWLTQCLPTNERGALLERPDRIGWTSKPELEEAENGVGERGDRAYLERLGEIERAPDVGATVLGAPECRFDPSEANQAERALAVLSYVLGEPERLVGVGERSRLVAGQELEVGLDSERDRQHGQRGRLARSSEDAAKKRPRVLVVLEPDQRLRSEPRLDED